MGPKKKQQEEETDKLTRIAIVSTDKCKPKRCRQECKKSCPVVRMGKLCIEVTSNDKYVSYVILKSYVMLYLTPGLLQSLRSCVLDAAFVSKSVLSRPLP